MSSSDKRVAQDNIGTVELEAVATHLSDSQVHHLDEKVVDGDDALRILNTHYEPFTPEEEYKVRRKIDWRMCSLMLLINGIQFIDKNVGCLVYLRLN